MPDQKYTNYEYENRKIDCPVCYNRVKLRDVITPQCGHSICIICFYKSYFIHDCDNCALCRFDLKKVDLRDQTIYVILKIWTMANSQLFAGHISKSKWNLKMLTKIWKHNRIISLKIFLSVQITTDQEINQYITNEEQKREIHALSNECVKKSVHHMGVQVFNPKLDN